MRGYQPMQYNKMTDEAILKAHPNDNYKFEQWKNNFEDEGQFFGDVFLSLFMFYNLIENFPIVIFNCGIMLKEAFFF